MDLPKTTFERTSKKNLINNYGLSASEIGFIKECVKREPIPVEIMNLLLENSNYTCNVCKGIKSDAFIVHHINEYSKSQDNEYQNLIVLCPNDHDLAHKKGKSLTNKITKEQLHRVKAKWEKEVEKHNCDIASKTGNFNRNAIDYINIPRISELAYGIFKRIPETSYTDSLKEQKILKSNGDFNFQYVKDVLSNGRYLFDYYSSGEAFHYYEVFLSILGRIDFENLESFLTVKEVMMPGFIGKHVYYVGGMYGRSPKLPITESTPHTILFFKRKRFYIEWKIDPMYLYSMTSIARLSQRTRYIVYGIIRDVLEKKINRKDYIHIDIRPYIAALPNKFVDKTPLIHWKNYTEEDL